MRVRWRLRGCFEILILVTTRRDERPLSFVIHRRVPLRGNHRYWWVARVGPGDCVWGAQSTALIVDSNAPGRRNWRNAALRGPLELKLMAIHLRVARVCAVVESVLYVTVSLFYGVWPAIPRAFLFSFQHIVQLVCFAKITTVTAGAVAGAVVNHIPAWGVVFQRFRQVMCVLLMLARATTSSQECKKDKLEHLHTLHRATSIKSCFFTASALRLSAPHPCSCPPPVCALVRALGLRPPPEAGQLAGAAVPRRRAGCTGSQRRGT